MTPQPTPARLAVCDRPARQQTAAVAPAAGEHALTLDKLLTQAKWDGREEDENALRAAIYALTARQPDGGDGEDQARLDWLEQCKGTCGYSENTYIGEGFYAHEHTQGDKYDAAPTLRQAIDAKRKESPTK